MKTRPVFESYEEFVYSIKNAIYEAETTGDLSSLKSALGGGLKFDKANKEKFDVIIDLFSALGVYEGQENDAKEIALGLKDYFNSGEDLGVQIYSTEISDEGEFNYEYLVNGTLTTKGEPQYNDETMSFYGAGSRATDISEPTPLSQMLINLFLYNLQIIYENTAAEKGATYSMKKLANGGKKGKNDPVNRFLTIDQKSFGGEVLQIVPLTTNWGTNKSSVEYGIKMPIWTIDPSKIVKGGGETIGSEKYEIVIPPAGNDTKVTDKPYNSSGIDFFGENSVEIGNEGIKALKSIISEFNSISSIVVSGGASNKSTSRAGGNEKLAADRRDEGIKKLEILKKEGVEQLKNAKITPGEAKVQSATEESDPANQQVSFKISGRIKNISGTESKATVIPMVDDLKADSVEFKLQYMEIYFNVNS